MVLHYIQNQIQNVDLENTDILSYLDFSYPSNLLKYDSEFIKMTEKVNSRISIQSNGIKINLWTFNKFWTQR
jgi:hypothetical protein